MDLEVEHKLGTLRSDYLEVTGRPFSHFFCPILFRDEDVALCRAHIVNSAFPDSSRSWTVQRADVDSFYGSAFESDFVDLQYRGKYLTDDAIIDPLLSKKLRPKVYIGEEEVEHFIANGPVPTHFTEVRVPGPNGQVRLGLKIRPDDALSAGEWRIAIEKDVRLAALVQCSRLPTSPCSRCSATGTPFPQVATSLDGVFSGNSFLTTRVEESPT